MSIAGWELDSFALLHLMDYMQMIHSLLLLFDFPLLLFENLPGIFLDEDDFFFFFLSYQLLRVLYAHRHTHTHEC